MVWDQPAKLSRAATRRLKSTPLSRRPENRLDSIRDHDVDGKPCLPAYYRGRIYIDFSDPSRYREEFHRLVRWIFDKPLHVAPELGNPPAWLSEDEKQVRSLAAISSRNVLDAIRDGGSNAVPAVVEYLEKAAAAIAEIELAADCEPFDDAVISSIDEFLPARDDLVEVFLTIALYGDDEAAIRGIHKFFEIGVSYYYADSHTTRHEYVGRENFRFVVHELFLYAIASLLKHERFGAVDQLLRTLYYVASQSDVDSFVAIRAYMYSSEVRNRRVQAGRLSIRADLLHDRTRELGLEFAAVMEADFLVFLRSRLRDRDGFGNWWPETLLYAHRHSAPFEHSARARSHDYFERFRVALV